MSSNVYYSPELLAPISAESPCGQDLRYEALFRGILDARRSDEVLNTGAWEKAEGRKTADWNIVAELCLDALQHKSKDLRLACFLTEASIHLDGFNGLKDSMRLCRELLETFWDQGLYPLIDEGDLELRASPFSWMNDPMPDVVKQAVNITARPGTEANYSFTRFQQAQRIGTEAAIASAPAERRETLSGLRKQGWISMDAFEGAVRATRRKSFEAIYAPFEEAEEELFALAKIVDEKFGDIAPSFTSAREAFAEMRGVLQPILKKKRDEEPDQPVGGGAESSTGESAAEAKARGDAVAFTAGLPGDNSQGWADAEKLLRAGKTDQALAQMAALAASEVSQRARFLRKLMLADVCLAAQRERLAKTILEELKTQIVDYKLEQWESSAVVGAVWSRLYRIYKRSDSSNEQDQAAILYTQLCQLDPWQAYLNCED